MMCRASLAAFAVLVGCALEVPRAASAAVTGTLRQSKDGEKRPIAETDLLKFTWIADPQISPDAQSVAFVQVTVNEKDNKSESALYSVPEEIDSEIARMKLISMNIKIDTLTAEQEKYLASWTEGT